ncbi:ABC transporter ATP-binding protein [Microseira sp. BLCC-F43]|jgi:NitT/TauT family transport system ATP-binding protein|uniref:ABC transporter ATP-binding protein n=1 Tax=Microseira sp. BLCC-F43 TaxID=3153602 RepID=UPI0035BA8F0B
MATSLAIALNNIGKVYPNGLVALENMSLAINQSQFVSIVGPSGCGKSTVLRMIAGLSTPSYGKIHWAKNPSQSGLPNRAFVFQEAALMPWATVTENIRLPLKLMKISQQEAEIAVEEAIALVGLKGFERAYPRQLSGGMKMRVSIARSLVTKPDVLLMDEPFGALDEMTRSKLNRDLLDLWQEKRWTVIFVTHNIYEAVYLSERVIVMASRPGRAIADVAIAAGYPRTEEFRLSSLYANYCQTIVRSLTAGVEGTEYSVEMSNRF